MPIRPELRHFYQGPEYEATRARIKQRAQDSCELCWVPNHASVERVHGWWLNPMLGLWVQASWDGGAPAAMPHGEFITTFQNYRPHWVRIVCTLAHLNHDPADNRDENLKFLCQWCHLNFDKLKHKETRSIRKDSTRPLLHQEAS